MINPIDQHATVHVTGHAQCRFKSRFPDMSVFPNLCVTIIKILRESEVTKIKKQKGSFLRFNNGPFEAIVLKRQSAYIVVTIVRNA